MSNCKSKKENSASQFLSFDYYFYIIFLKPRTEKFFKQSSGQSMGVKDGKNYL